MQQLGRGKTPRPFLNRKFPGCCQERRSWAVNLLAGKGLAPVRTTRRAGKIILYIVLALAALFAGLSMAGMKLIHDEQFGRFERPDRAATAELHHSDLRGLFPLELVSFLSGNNRLQGYLYAVPGSPGLIVVSHGLGGGADSYLPQIRYFLNQGWSVFAYDATGSYDSEGEAVRGFPQAILDLDAALRFVESHPGLAGLPVLLFGHSWGGYAAANILHFDHPVAGVVSIAAPSSAMEMIMEQGAKMLGSIMTTQRPFLWLYQWLLYGKTASLDAVDALNKTRVPVLVIHGTADTTVEFQGSAIISKRERITNPQVEFLVLDEPGRSGHNNILWSREAQAYVQELNRELRALEEQYGGEIPPPVKRQFFAQVDRERANELNLELMERINSFFLSCLAGT